MKRSTGVSWAPLFNASLQPDPVDAWAVADAAQEVRKHLDQIERFEKTADLFKEYP